MSRVKVLLLGVNHSTSLDLSFHTYEKVELYEYLRPISEHTINLQ
jgi:hypothetical protein